MTLLVILAWTATAAGQSLKRMPDGRNRARSRYGAYGINRRN
jgi:hypothetical protein